MRSSKKSLADAKLYLILDTNVNRYDELLNILKHAVAGGVGIVQLRDKPGNAKDILEFCRKADRIIKGRVPFIINDRVDVALMAPSSGVHLGQEDIPLKAARKLMGESAIIGVSCQTWEQARQAEEDGADYIGFGSVFKTKTKPDRSPMDLKLLARVVREIRIPVFAIGGIDRTNVAMLRSLGVGRVAVCRDICEAKNVRTTVQAFKRSLK